MIITKTPMRVTMAGGGTDVLWYSKLRGGAWISAAINKYVYCIVKEFEDKSLLKISDGETTLITDDYKKIPNPVIRECLDLTGVTNGIELSTMSDASSKSGIGGSGAFTVGLLNALYTYKKEALPQFKLAQQACDVELRRLKIPGGPQDMYITALGGINCFELDKTGNLKVELLHLSIDTITELENNLMYFRTGIQHETKKIHGVGKLSVEKKDDKSEAFIKMYDDIKELGRQAKQYLLEGKLDEYGKTLHEHWLIKTRQKSVTSSQIDIWYDEGIKAGALGGKIMGAGGGGWFVFYVNKNKDKFRRRMEEIGLEERRVRFDWEGTKVLVNLS